MSSSIDLGQLLLDSGAVLKGHFVLTSGRHSDVYFEKFRILEQPHVLSPLCTEIAERFHGQVDIVAGPTTGGIIIAFEVARQLGVNAVYVESESGVKLLRRNAKIEPDARVLVVDDVLTTGLSLKETIQVVEREGAKVVGAAALIDRATGDIDLGCPLFSAYKVEAETFDPDDVPSWLADLPIIKPGTRV